MVTGCEQEASYWIDTSEGFTERLLEMTTAPDTFYICTDHMNDLDLDGSYRHLRIDTGEIYQFEIGKYCCHDECEDCLEA
jgi:hypothetical protein